MRQKAYFFLLSAFLYWIVATYAGYVFISPSKTIYLATFVPPIIGLMWGPCAAMGAYVGGLFALPELRAFLANENDIGNWFLYFVRGSWVFFAGYLPNFLWYKWRFNPKKYSFPLEIDTFKKFLTIIAITFMVTAVFRTLTAPAVEMEEVTRLLDVRKSIMVPTYMFVCFANDFFMALFFDLALFFLLLNIRYEFYQPSWSMSTASIEPDKHSTSGSDKAWITTLAFYLLFPIGIIYLVNFQVYGTDHIKTWISFILKCIAFIDVYLVMMFYMLLRYRRSIMMEVAFLVSQTVFFSATVLGWGFSVSMSNVIENNTNRSLHSLSVICRERLDRTFFSARQAVSGMKLQALESLESYDKFLGDANYRKQYLADMRKNFNSIALNTTGSLAYYMRLAPEIDGTKGGFSMKRAESRWEGTPSPFVSREPMDLALYSPDDEIHVGWYYTPLKIKHATWIEPYIDDLSDSYVISYVDPLFVDGKFIGVIGMDIDFKFIIHELRRMSIYDYGHIYIVNRNNIVLYHKDQPQGSLLQPDPEFKEIELYLSNGMWLGIAIPLSRIHEEQNRLFMNLVAAIIIVAMLISILSITFASKAISPLERMTEAAKRIASGDLNVEISYESDNELGILVQSIRDMATKLESYVYRDKLTGLRNAAAYISKAGELEAKNKIYPDIDYGVIIFDANFLKKVNDNYGHDAGNELIRRAAKAICRVFAHSPVYRIGGDEFAAVLEGQDYEDRQELLQRFDEELEKESFQAAGDTLKVSVARGLGIHERGMDFATVAHKADVAMYNHKSAIKSKFGEDVR